MGSPDFVVGNNYHLKEGTARAERWLLRRIFDAIGPAPIRLVVENGAEMSPPGISPRATVLIRDRRTLLKLIVDPEVAFSDRRPDSGGRRFGPRPGVGFRILA